jgi:outer membrane lipoprotein-sorting protein
VGIVRKFTALLLGLALFAPMASASPDNPSVSELVSAVEATYGTATSIRAEFTQVQHSTAMGTDIKQHGRIAAERPRKLRVETGEIGQPIQQTMVSDGKTLRIYNAKEKQLTEMPEMGDGGGMGADVLLGDLGRIGELFDVTILPQTPSTKPSYTVQLVPKQPGAVKSLKLTFSKQKYVVQDLVIVNQMDDVTTMNFTMVRMNQDIPETEFTLVPPPGVNVVKNGAM